MKKHIQLETERTKYCRDMYRPSSSLSRFLRTVITVLVEGHNPAAVNHPYARKRR